MRGLEGKVAIVAGGATLIGEHVVRRFLEHGTRVGVGDVDVANGERIVGELGPDVRFVRRGRRESFRERVRRPTDLRALVVRARESGGVHRVTTGGIACGLVDHSGRAVEDAGVSSTSSHRSHRASFDEAAAAIVTILADDGWHKSTVENALAREGVSVARGVFGTRRQLELVDDGPVTIVFG